MEVIDPHRNTTEASAARMNEWPPRCEVREGPASTEGSFTVELHPLEAALGPPGHRLLEADGVAQPHQLLADIHSLGDKDVLVFFNDPCKETEDEHGSVTHVVVVELDAGPGGDLRMGVAAQFGLQGAPAGAGRQLLKVIQGCLSPHLS
ncbi:hypothetical protein EYF80_039204 [Liparis tanakae]|uniref:Uncharacterized protein n=1 Tax=Liparis tanakae TaxID=230148 RepID=A0A4Z2GCY5_9TELE|nr:hypothetical protein EYF80_039204 [Liparis tanakae]